MSKKRHLAGLIVLLACGLIAAGCGGSDDDDANAEAEAALEELQNIDDSDPEAAQEAAQDVLDSLESAEDLAALCRVNVEQSGLEGEDLEGALARCEDAPDPDDIDLDEVPTAPEPPAVPAP